MGWLAGEMLLLFVTPAAIASSEALFATGPFLGADAVIDLLQL
jgi:hypothetical protein